MDRISGLSDELLIKILLLLPTKVAVSTSILSKRWECLWMWLPKLEYEGGYRSPNKSERLRCFLDRNLPLHRAPVIESFRLESTLSCFGPQDIKLWIVIAVSRHLRELDISYYGQLKKENILPSSLYTSKSLLVLKLDGVIRLDVPRMVCLPSLKTLQLGGNNYLDGNSLQRLLSICPLLEHLVVEFCETVKTGKITINVQSLQSLSLCIPYEGYADEFVIDTPSLKYLKLEDHNDKEDHIEELHSCLIENMPKLEEAYVDVTFPDIERLIRSIISVKCLTICSEVVYGDSFVFNQLERLKLCVGRKFSSNLLVRLLNDSPNLRKLELYEMTDHGLGGLISWNEPSTVPDCMVSNLQTFNWTKYYGRPQEKDLAFYILKNARRLKTATISSRERFVTKLEMITELSLSSRASTTCQLFLATFVSWRFIYPYDLKSPIILPSSLYTSKSLVILKLDGKILLDVPRMACLLSLKTLQLGENKYLDGESLGRLLSICPVLEDVSVIFVVESETGMITVAVPSLQRLSLYIDYEGCSIDGLVIDTPSLKYFKLEDDNWCIPSHVIENMPKLEEANVDVRFDIEPLIRSIISVESLTICSQDVYGDGFVFNQLKHLRLCLFRKVSSNLLVRLLNDSPNLRELDFYAMTDHGLGGLISWNEPSTVPECMMSSLQTFNWSQYYGRPQERDFVVYILKNARRLETATISSDARFVPKLEMIKELSLSSPASTTCQLIFD